MNDVFFSGDKSKMPEVRDSLFEVAEESNRSTLAA
jgi:hypothetical protein